ncbi:DUF429 domain-containing protein [Microbacteriaceae bacterium VKM Ac-2855]|nr:DUF429 domain-containing protein [Microbacteriaceae bacterium VKM Ac-2855]
MTLFVGIDLAWGEGSAARRANETGLAAIDATGRVLAAGWARGIDAVTDWIDQTVGTADALIAVDAPLAVHNPSGMRAAEREVGRGYGRWRVAANASSLTLPWLGGVTLRRRLETLGYAYTDGLEPTPPRAMFECYPYTTIVGAAELGYDVERPRYKRFNTSLPPEDRRPARAAACDELIRRLAQLDTGEVPLALRSHPLTAALVDEPSPLKDAAYKHREDLLDAVIAAWTAALWARHGLERCQVLGAEDEVVAGMRATIIAVARPEQRVRPA